MLCGVGIVGAIEMLYLHINNETIGYKYYFFEIERLS